MRKWSRKLSVGLLGTGLVLALPGCALYNTREVLVSVTDHQTGEPAGEVMVQVDYPSVGVWNPPREDYVWTDQNGQAYLWVADFGAGDIRLTANQTEFYLEPVEVRGGTFREDGRACDTPYQPVSTVDVFLQPMPLR